LKTKQFLTRLYRRYDRDGVADSAAALSYYFVFALFPFLFLLATLVAYVPYVQASADTLLARARSILPPEAMALIDAHVRGLVAKPRPQLLTLGLLLTLYAASRGMDAVRNALNIANGARESRPLWKTELLAFGMTVGGALAVLTSVAALAAGGSAGFWLAGQLGIAAPYVFVWGWLRWPVTAGVIALGSAAGYHLLPDVKRKFRLVTPGSAIGTVAWFSTTWAFGAYVTHFGSYNVAYGSIGGVIVLMTWFYLTGFIFLLGGEIDAMLATPESGAPEAAAPREAAPPTLRSAGALRH
jgi:membrane protein